MQVGDWHCVWLGDGGLAGFDRDWLLGANVELAGAQKERERACNKVLRFGDGKASAGDEYGG